MKEEGAFRVFKEAGIFAIHREWRYDDAFHGIGCMENRGVAGG
jgi:hypothetical protein